MKYNIVPHCNVHEAAINGDLRAIKRYWPACANIFDADVVKLAAEHGHLPVVKYLFRGWIAPFIDDIRHAIRPSAPIDQCALAAAAANGHLEVVKYLVRRHAPWDQSAMKLAIRNGHLEVVRYLYECDAPFYAELVLEASDIHVINYFRRYRYLRNVCQLALNAHVNRFRDQSG